MTHAALPALLLLLLAPAASVEGARTGSGIDGVELAQLTIHPRIVIRVPRILGRSQRSEPAQPHWSEKKGPRCIPAGGMIGALVQETASVDLVMIDGARIRAQLEDDCPALDFYSGVYLRQTEDGLVCADRDSIRSRSGSVCKIDGFRRLVLKR